MNDSLLLKFEGEFVSLSVSIHIFFPLSMMIYTYMGITGIKYSAIHQEQR